MLYTKKIFKLVTEDQNNQFCLKGGKNKITIQAQSSKDFSHTITPVEVKDNKDGNYSASFVANQVGKVNLSVLLSNKLYNYIAITTSACL